MPPTDEREGKELQERVRCWLENLREAMPPEDRARLTSPTGEAIVGAAINAWWLLAQERKKVAAATQLREQIVKRLATLAPDDFRTDRGQHEALTWVLSLLSKQL